MSLISVIIPTYNSASLIKRTLSSVLAQSGDFEIIVVDDCSTDHTLDIVCKIQDSRITILRQSENRGPAAARNRGLNVAKGIYSAFLDGDDYWEPSFLQKTSAFLETHPEAVAVSVMQCHKIIGKSPLIVPECTPVDTPILLDDFFKFWNEYNHVCTGSVLFRTCIAQQIGGQREDLRICEDLEFWAMLALKGQWGFIPDVLFTSDGGEVTRSQGWLQKNMIRWNNAPFFSEWRKRIDEQPQQWKTASMENALGRIARNLCYCHIMAKKDSLARYETRHYGHLYPQNKVNAVFRLASRFSCFWHLWCCLLRMREFHRQL